MKNYYKSFIILIAILFQFISNAVDAQSTNKALEYMNKISTSLQQVNEQYLIYISAANHGKSARKVEKRRKELITQVSAARNQMKAMQPFEGDSSLKTSYYTYLDLAFKVLKEDYEKIVNMEEIAEQSYDNMEAYILAKEKASEIVEEASEKNDLAYRKFAAAHNITILEDKSDMAKKSAAVTKVLTYYNKVYLIFFKSYKQELYLLSAIGSKDMSGLEQNRISLSKTSEQGIKDLDSLGAYKSDFSLVTNCKKLLAFYKKEADEKIPTMTEFMILNEKLTEQKKNIDSGHATDKEKADFNKNISAQNQQVIKYNKTNEELNKSRGALLDAYNNGVESFLSRHTPVVK